MLPRLTKCSAKAHTSGYGNVISCITNLDILFCLCAALVSAYYSSLCCRYIYTYINTHTAYVIAQMATFKCINCYYIVGPYKATGTAMCPLGVLSGLAQAQVFMVFGGQIFHFGVRQSRTCLCCCNTVL
jgi:hypothetical protein